MKQTDNASILLCRYQHDINKSHRRIFADIGRYFREQQRDCLCLSKLFNSVNPCESSEDPSMLYSILLRPC